MKYHKECECCGHKLSAYTHNLNEPLISIFSRFVEKFLKENRPINVNQELDGTHNQLCNWQKLRYFGIIQKVDGQGMWVPTRTGIAFYFSEVPLTTPVATINKQVIADDHEAWATHEAGRETKYIHEIDATHYKRRPEYQSEKSSQDSMF